jgi:hypothetical protein
MEPLWNIKRNDTFPEPGIFSWTISAAKELPLKREQIINREIYAFFMVAGLEFY